MRWLSLLAGIAVTVGVSFLFWWLGGRLSSDLVLRFDNAGILLGYLIASLSPGVGVYAWLRRQDIRRWLSRRRFQSVGEEFQVDKEKVTAVVIPVSRREQPEWIVRWLEPRSVSLLYTESSRAVAAALAKEFEDQGLKLFPQRSSIAGGAMEVRNPDDPDDSRRIVQKYLAYYLDVAAVPAGEIFVDTTGGKKPMSIGAFQAAEEMGVSSIYVVGKANGEIKDPEKREHGYPVFISDRTV